MVALRNVLDRNIILKNVEVDGNGCWLWTRNILLGYGRIGIGGKNYLAHRISAHLWLGMPLDSKLNSCHHCDVPRCCNPIHLFVGTHKDNMADAAKKGRTTQGTKSPNSKLTDDCVREIRRLWRGGMKTKDISDRFPASRSVVSSVCNGKSWKHIKAAQSD